MFRYRHDRHLYHSTVLWLVVVLWFLALSNSIFSVPIHRTASFIAGQSFYLLYNPPKEADRITIVAIDEQSRRRLNLKWPWKRSVTAELIEKIASRNPRVIGLDIVFSGLSTEGEDKRLAASLASHPNIVLAYALKSGHAEGPHKMFLKAAPAKGFVNKPMHGGVIDAVRTFYKGPDGVELSFDAVILAKYLGLHESDIRVDEKGFYLGKMRIPSPGGVIALNYLVHPSGLTIVPAHMVLEDRVDGSLFKDRIVLIGATDPLIHDMYPTPVGLFPGVAIVADSIVMLLSGRFLRSAPYAANLAFVLLFGLTVLYINRRPGLLRSTLLTALLFVLVYISFIYTRSLDVEFWYLPVLFSGTVAYVVPNLYRYLNLMYMSARLKNLAITDPLTGLYTPRYFLLRLDHKLRSKTPVGTAALRIANYRRLTLLLNFEQLKLLVRLLGGYIERRVKVRFGGGSFSRISNDTLGVVITDARKEEIKDFLYGLIEEVEGMEWDLGGGKVNIELRACLVYSNGNTEAASADVICQLENCLRRNGDGRLVVADIEKGTAGEKKMDYDDILDFIAYDWEEKNRDLEQALREVLAANRKLEQLNWGALRALARAVDAKSSWTAGHSERVTRLALRIGKKMGLSQEELEDLHRAGLLHDIGKIGTPIEIIDKAGKLTAEEYRVVRNHPLKGANILEPITEYARVIPMVLEHHERFDGSGYPNGLAGAEISLGGRILAVADFFDALVSDRPYRAGIPVEKVIEIIKEGSGTDFDPHVVEAFLMVVAEEDIAKKQGAEEEKEVSGIEETGLQRGL